MNKDNIKVALCPMAGITDSPFRLMNVLGGADLVYSEMAHVNAISFGNKKTFEMLKASPLEGDYVVQLFGKDPEHFAKAAKIISEEGVPVMKYKPFGNKEMEFLKGLESRIPQPYGSGQARIFKKFYSRFLKFQDQITHYPLPITHYSLPSGLDINLGCPAKKVFHHGSGAALWKNLGKVRKILGSVLENTSLPVSIKVRTSVEKVNLEDLMKVLEGLPIKSIMIHGRSYEQGFSGPIDMGAIKKIIKNYSQFEIWINGGIYNSLDARGILKKTGASKLGIARGTYGNPLLAEEIKSKTEDKKTAGQLIIIKSILAFIHANLNYQAKGKKGIIEMRKHLTWYFKDFSGAKDLRKKLVKVESLKEIEKILKNLF